MIKFKLKNSTTLVSAEKSISAIEQMLSAFGATQIMKEFYTDGRCKGIAFKLEQQVFKLPANIEGVRNYLFANKTDRIDGNKSRDERAYRVAWRILKDWVASQFSIVASGQAQPDEVLLPYLWNGRETFYTAYKEGKLQLGAPKDDMEVKK